VQADHVVRIFQNTRYEGQDMDDSQKFQVAYHIDRDGRGTEINREESKTRQPLPGLLWVHLNYTDPDARQWLQKKSGLSGIVIEALLSEETRPRVNDIDDGLLISLRGINQNPGSEPEDMVSLRLWIDKDWVISTGKRRLLSVEELSRDISQGKGPKNAGDFLVEISERLLSQMSSVTEEVEEDVDKLEEEVLLSQSQELRSGLGSVRRQIIELRRYIAPQRDAMTTIQLKKTSWLTVDDKMRLREVSDHITRFVENLDSVRDRASLLHEELVGRLSDSINERIYLLSLMATVFLPLTFLTGLLGINIAGIPGAQNSHAFAIFCLFLMIIVLFQLWFFRRKRWI
jgi:zinc transporter